MSAGTMAVAEGRVVGVMHTGITVSNLERAREFFREVLGASVTEPRICSDPLFERVTGVAGADIRIAFANLPGHQIELLQYVGPAGRQVSTLRPCDSGHLHLSLNVKGMDRLMLSMQSYGFHPSGPIQYVAARGMKVIYMHGFDSLVIELMEFDETP